MDLYTKPPVHVFTGRVQSHFTFFNMHTTRAGLSFDRPPLNLYGRIRACRVYIFICNTQRSTVL